MTDKKCRHRRRKFVSSYTDRCLDCGLLYTMIAGRSSVMRRWVKPDDPRVEAGEVVTEALLEH